MAKDGNTVQLSVIPAKAGIQEPLIYWVPALAGTTMKSQP
jgi:hypothetical protein